jgi:hypothetical protein
VHVRTASCDGAPSLLAGGEVASDGLLRGRLELHEGDFVTRRGARLENLFVRFKAQRRVAGVLTHEATYAMTGLHVDSLHPDESVTTMAGIVLGARTDLYDDSFDLRFHADGAVAMGRPMQPQRIGGLLFGDPALRSLSQHAVVFWPNGRVMCATVSDFHVVPSRLEQAPSIVLFSPSGRPALYVPHGADRPLLVSQSAGRNAVSPAPEGHPAHTWFPQCDDLVVGTSREGADAELSRLREFLEKS